MKNEIVPLPHPSRLSKEDKNYLEIIKLHETAFINGEDYYSDPNTGNIVFTALYHLKRGYCCESGCRHCPYVK